jgi:hypothetical protein
VFRAISTTSVKTKMLKSKFHRLFTKEALLESSESKDEDLVTALQDDEPRLRC